jgi:thymidylate kinase
MDGTSDRRSSPIIITFSGIDGAGKTTQISNLCSFLGQAGVKFRLVKFWDEVASLASCRESLSLSLFKGDPGVGTPEKPVNRRDKNVQSPFLNVARIFLYFLDTVSLRSLVTKSENCEVLIFDRYFYDELSNLPFRDSVLRHLTRLFSKSAPHPDVAFVIDAEPETARARKPEYPLEFLRRNRDAYLALSEIAGLVVVPAGTAQEVADVVVGEVARKLCMRTQLAPLQPVKMAS